MDIILHYPHCFSYWFNKDTFDWEVSAILASGCRDDFDQWFDPKLFNWQDGSEDLALYCSSKFLIWFNPYTFAWSTMSSIALATDCGEYANIWYYHCPIAYREQAIKYLSIKDIAKFQLGLTKQ